MFAFAIWDERRGRLLLARDRLGKKPLYVAETDGGLAFGSDLRSVALVTGRQPVLDRERVAEFLFQRYTGAPHTLFQGIEKLPPGHALTFDGERVDGARTGVRRRTRRRSSRTSSANCSATRRAAG